LAKPSSDEYWHIGETPMRLANSTERSWKGEKSGWLINARSGSWAVDLKRACRIDETQRERMHFAEVKPTASAHLKAQ
jgi:hypothetical protein